MSMRLSADHGADAEAAAVWSACQIVEREKTRIDHLSLCRPLQGPKKWCAKHIEDVPRQGQAEQVSNSRKEFH